ncbi:YdjY domain-containing protein [Brachyspira alvinipulli]|uniref:YdjY domain-containing protein n=1 Tax=Brachyspira alvinipulli TaxID=84379 RepID=UPI0030043F35
MNKKIILTCLLFVSLIVSCNKQTAATTDTAAATDSNTELTNSVGSVILRDEGAEPVIIDMEKKEVIVPAEVNGKYFNSPTRHGVVFDRGSNGDKSVLRGLADEREFYQALIDIGAVPGNNLTMEDMKLEKTVDGQKLDVFVTWDGLGKEIPFADIIRSDDERPMDIRFGGNLENAKDKRTGCILCLDSCAVGITSDAAYETGAVEIKKIGRYGREDVLPADGTRVSVIFRIATNN